MYAFDHTNDITLGPIINLSSMIVVSPKIIRGVVVVVSLNYPFHLREDRHERESRDDRMEVSHANELMDYYGTESFETTMIRERWHWT